MASNNFVNSFMTSFKDDLTTQADKSLKKYLKTYKDKLDKIEKTNQTNIQQNMVEYHKKRKELQDKFDQKINAMIAEASKKMDTQLTNIDDKLFTDRSKLYQKILTAAQDLQKKRDEFAKERRKWDKDDKRCAAWLGLSYKDTKPSKKDPKIKDDDNKDDMKAGLDGDDFEEPANSADNVDNLKIEKITDEDFITIKVDDRVFRTYRGTLTQVKGSFIQKLFGPHHDLIHRDNDGIYYLNCNPDTFGNVLEILRKRGAMPADFKITPKLYAALVEYGILDTFFPTANLSELLAGLDIKKKQDYHVVFQSFRSSDNNSNYLRWNVNHLSSSDQKDDDDSQYWQLNANDNSEILFLKTGFYRITFRCCISHTSVTYGRIYVNGSATEICYHYNTNNGAHLKSYNFNDIKEFKEGDKLKLYAGVAANKEAKASYLCIERVPDAILPSVGIWTSSASNSYYRQWNATIKTSDRYTLANANKNITLQKGGLYRISGRMHTNYTSTGTRAMQLYEFRNGTNNGYYNNQASNSTSYECHLIDEISSFKKADYFQFYDGSYAHAGSTVYDQVQIQHIPFAHAVSHWRSNASKDTYIRIWDYEMWYNDMLYVLSTDKTRIEVKETGNYRISASLTNSQPSGQGHSALFINDTEYCLSRMGCYNGTWRHTTSIQEIVKLNDGDKLHFYSTAPYNSYTYNSFFIEKLF